MIAPLPDPLSVGTSSIHRSESQAYPILLVPNYWVMKPGLGHVFTQHDLLNIPGADMGKTRCGGTKGELIIYYSEQAKDSMSL